MTQIRNFVILQTVPDEDGFFPVEAIPLGGDPIPLSLSEGALQDVVDFDADRIAAAAKAAKQAEKAAKNKDSK